MRPAVPAHPGWGLPVLSQPGLTAPLQHRPLRAIRRAVLPRPSWLQLRDVEGRQGCPGADVDGPVVPLAEPGTPIGPGEGTSCQRGPDQPGAVDRVDSVTCTAASGLQT